MKNDAGSSSDRAQPHTKQSSTDAASDADRPQPTKAESHRTRPSTIGAALTAAGCLLLSLLPRRWVAAVAAVSLCVGLLLLFPRYDRADDDRMFAQLRSLMEPPSTDSVTVGSAAAAAPLLRVPVMSFNIRFDGPESDPANHFLQRLPRIARLFERVHPWVAGLQEALSGQLTHTLSVLDPKYKAVTYRRAPGQPAHVNDAKVAIVYDSTRLTLLEQDYLWLSDTPRLEATDWTRDDPTLPFDPRCLNIARFRIKQSDGADGSNAAEPTAADRTGAEPTADPTAAAAEPLELIHFNTHLSMRSESARRRGSALAASVVGEWRRRYPRALLVFTGDFNTAPGQTAHRTLTAEGLLTDSFAECARTEGCTTSSVANSFHGWRGTQPNSYLWRAAQVALFTLYGGGLRIPHHMPHTLREVARAVRDLWAELKSPPFSLAEAVPLWPFDRFHVDWILYAKGTQQEDAEAGGTHTTAEDKTAPDDDAADGRSTCCQSSASDAAADCPSAAYCVVWSAGASFARPSSAPSMRPLLSSVLDARSSEYSSDHFPIVTIFEVTR